MSLKAIHIVFVVASSLLSVFFGLWSWREYAGPQGMPIHLVYAVLSLLALGGLLAYGRYFLRKLKHISYL
jgi:hypothetical protein